jgi:hypothetical protein
MPGLVPGIRVFAGHRWAAQPPARQKWNFDKKIKSMHFALQENLCCHANKTVAGGIWYT